MARPCIVAAVLVLPLSPGFTREAKEGSKFLSNPHWAHFLNAIEAAQFLSPVREVSRRIRVAIQFGEGSDHTAHQNQPICLVRGEADPEGKAGPRALQGELWFL